MLEPKRMPYVVAKAIITRTLQLTGCPPGRALHPSELVSVRGATNDCALVISDKTGYEAVVPWKYLSMGPVDSYYVLQYNAMPAKSCEGGPKLEVARTSMRVVDCDSVIDAKIVIEKHKKIFILRYQDNEVLVKDVETGFECLLPRECVQNVRPIKQDLTLFIEFSVKGRGYLAASVTLNPTSLEPGRVREVHIEESHNMSIHEDILSNDPRRIYWGQDGQGRALYSRKAGSGPLHWVDRKASAELLAYNEELQQAIDALEAENKTITYVKFGASPKSFVLLAADALLEDPIIEWFALPRGLERCLQRLLPKLGARGVRQVSINRSGGWVLQADKYYWGGKLPNPLVDQLQRGLRESRELEAIYLNLRNDNEFVAYFDNGLTLCSLDPCFENQLRRVVSKHAEMTWRGLKWQFIPTPAQHLAESNTTNNSGGTTTGISGDIELLYQGTHATTTNQCPFVALETPLS